MPSTNAKGNTSEKGIARIHDGWGFFTMRAQRTMKRYRDKQGHLRWFSSENDFFNLFDLMVTDGEVFKFIQSTDYGDGARKEASILKACHRFPKNLIMEIWEWRGGGKTIDHSRKVKRIIPHQVFYVRRLTEDRTGFVNIALIKKNGRPWDDSDEFPTTGGSR